MTGKKSRFDPYKNFKFRVLAATVVGLATFVIARRITRPRADPEAVRRNAYWRLFG